MEMIVCKYKYNANNQIYEFIRELFVNEDEVASALGAVEVKYFYRYDVKSVSGNILHQLYTIDASLFD